MFELKLIKRLMCLKIVPWCMFEQIPDFTAPLSEVTCHLKLQIIDFMESMRGKVDIDNNDQKNVKDKIESQTDFVYDLQPGDKELLRPFTYHASIAVTKNIFHKFIEVLNYWMDVPKDKIAKISEVVRNLQHLGLVIDDIQDNTRLRNGVPAAHTIFGITKATNAVAFHEHGLAEIVLQLNHPKALRIYVDAILEFLRGQGMEIYWRDNATCPTEEEYNQMVLEKAGCIFFLAKNSMQLFARKHVEVDRLLTAISLYFQINDDYQNLTSDLYFRNKGFCEDLTEGKFGYPTMHAVNNNPEGFLGVKLYNAAENGDINTVKAIVTSAEGNPEFNINYRNRWGNTPLFIACAWGFRNTAYRSSSFYEIAVFLIQHGADVNIANDKNQTPLFIAAAWGHPHIVRLLTSQANINLNVQVPDTSNFTPLQIAAYSSRYENRHGNYKIYSKHHAYYAAFDSMNHIEKTGYGRLFPEMLKDYEMLIAYSAVDPYVDIPIRIMDIIVKYNHFVVVEELVRAGADVNLLDKKRGTALDQAIFWNHGAMQQLLLENGALLAPPPDKQGNIKQEPASQQSIKQEISQCSG